MVRLLLHDQRLRPVRATTRDFPFLVVIATAPSGVEPYVVALCSEGILPPLVISLNNRVACVITASPAGPG
jgi:hypothetical protein